MSDNADGPDGSDDIGGVGEEAAKLFGVLAGWARDVGDHIDTGGTECTLCPICRTVHVIRQASPEVRDHLAVAASSLMQAAVGVLVAASRGSKSDHSPGVERINLDLDGDDDEWPQPEPGEDEQ